MELRELQEFKQLEIDAMAEEKRLQASMHAAEAQLKVNAGVTRAAVQLEEEDYARTVSVAPDSLFRDDLGVRDSLDGYLPAPSIESTRGQTGTLLRPPPYAQTDESRLDPGMPGVAGGGAVYGSKFGAGQGLNDFGPGILGGGSAAAARWSDAGGGGRGLLEAPRESVESLAELESLLEEQHRELVARGLLPEGTEFLR